ncbi:protein arginine N-methyltransferase 6-like [Oscarella lobularis]|uniref:protein arginine N-methyltransferase 6-like n=1 Tax=Oscarella lobularis TaxID=121494 RepID=UPI0033138099
MDSKRRKLEERYQVCLNTQTQDSSNANDELYFRSYSDLSIHEEMLRDKIRTSAYRDAIEKTRAMQRAIVADVGSGTGILSCFCVQSGAQKVYAVEASDAYEFARQVTKVNGLDKNVTVVHNKVEDFVPPEKVDVIVSEWMGYFLLYEGMWRSVLWARDHWLKPGGLMLPSSAEIFLAPISDPDYWLEKVDFWLGVKKEYGVDMSALSLSAWKSVCSNVRVVTVDAVQLLAREHKVVEFNMADARVSDLEHVKSRFDFSCMGSGTLHGFAAWFKTDFEGSDGIVLSTSPWDEPTHWQQSVMYIEVPQKVEQDTKIKGSLEIRTNSENSRFLDIVLSFSVNDSPEVSSLYRMTDHA